ncbi:MAG: hypothetical protein M5U28_41060 [Sandaracinaceae bacterium]|nr:hypothetical protein [Sandaracinaceae bacterium]
MVTVVVRAGVGAVESPSVADSLERLRREAPLPTPMGLSRWLGRLKTALDGGDVELVARLLDGAAQLAADLRRDKPSAEVRRRVVGWLGGGADVTAAVERLSDRVLVEIAREQLPSSERGGIERRHLVDLSDGEVFREERTRTSPVASVGPCPRVINVGLAEVEEGASPRRIRLMQYAVSLELGRAELERIEANAYRRFAALADRYRALIDAQPGQAEPFAVVAPRAFEHGAGALCRDDEGQPLPFARADDPSALDVLERIVPAERPALGGRPPRRRGRRAHDGALRVRHPGRRRRALRAPALRPATRGGRTEAARGAERDEGRGPREERAQGQRPADQRLDARAERVVCAREELDGARGGARGEEREAHRAVRAEDLGQGPARSGRASGRGR